MGEVPLHGGDVQQGGAACHRALAHHPGVESRANLKSVSHRCHLFEVAFVWELTKDAIDLPLCCLQGGLWAIQGLAVKVQHRCTSLIRNCTQP